MTQVTRPVLATLSAFGASLPTAVKNFRGHLYWKRANGSEDEIYAGVKDASNVNQLRRILTKTYGDTLYAPIGALPLAVQSGDTNVDTAVSTLDFASPAFAVTSSPSGEANVDLFYRAAQRYIYKETFPQDNSTSWLTVGMGAPTVTASSTSNTDNVTGPQIQLTTAASSGDVASIAYGNGGSPRFDFDCDSEFVVAAGATITSIRIWIGAFSGTVSNSDDPTAHGWGFHFNPSSSANWRAWCNDNSGGGTITDTGVAVASTSTTRFRAVTSSNGTSIAYYINDALVATHSTNLPTTTTYLQHFVSVTALSASARSVRVGKLSITHDR